MRIEALHGWVLVSLEHARAWANISLTRGPDIQGERPHSSLFSRASSTCLGLYFLIVFFLHLYTSFPLLFCIRSAALACIT
jgi:hypothetical protein